MVAGFTSAWATQGGAHPACWSSSRHFLACSLRGSAILCYIILRWLQSAVSLPWPRRATVQTPVPRPLPRGSAFANPGFHGRNLSAQGFQKAPLCLAWTMAFLFPQIPLVCMRYMTDSRSQAILQKLRVCMGQRSGIVRNCSRTMFQIVYFLKLEVHCLHTEWL